MFNTIRKLTSVIQIALIKGKIAIVETSQIWTQRKHLRTLKKEISDQMKILNQSLTLENSSKLSVINAES